uniref:Uncharacterized protein n=1 Tax=Ditylenchus dipsaci TaxID=166011 RepID=A0A915E2W6_9BILA
MVAKVEIVVKNVCKPSAPRRFTKLFDTNSGIIAPNIDATVFAIAFAKRLEIIHVSVPRLSQLSAKTEEDVHNFKIYDLSWRVGLLSNITHHKTPLFYHLDADNRLYVLKNDINIWEEYELDSTSDNVMISSMFSQGINDWKIYSENGLIHYDHRQHAAFKLIIDPYEKLFGIIAPNIDATVFAIAFAKRLEIIHVSVPRLSQLSAKTVAKCINNGVIDKLTLPVNIRQSFEKSIQEPMIMESVESNYLKKSREFDVV